MTDLKQTRAATPPPPSKSFLPEAATSEPVKAANNMRGRKEIMMSFNVPAEWHSAFKTTASMRGISMRELLFEISNKQLNIKVPPSKK
ncbi:hypothetical protein [Agrobacterium sp. CG674]